MGSLGETVRKLRQGRGLPLRTLAAYLDIDQAILSKIERGQRHPLRGLVIKLAAYFKIKADELLLAWLSDKVTNEVKGEDLAVEALRAAEKKVAYRTSERHDGKATIKKMKSYFESDKRVAKAWVFGSFARGEHTPGSDIDLMVRFQNPEQVSLFDYADIAYQLEKRLRIKVDLVEEGYLSEFALETAWKDLTPVHG